MPFVWFCPHFCWFCDKFLFFFCYFCWNKSQVKYTSVGVFFSGWHQNRFSFCFVPKKLFGLIKTREREKNNEWVMKFEQPNEIWDITTSYLNKIIYMFSSCSNMLMAIFNVWCDIWDHVWVWNGQQGQSNRIQHIVKSCCISFFFFSFLRNSSLWLFLVWGFLSKQIQLIVTHPRAD